jgi:inositol-phosphate transport system substrate-binding protein
MYRWSRLTLIVGLLLGLGLLAGGLTYVQGQDVQTVKLRAWTVGPDDPSITRMWTLQQAVESLNVGLKDQNLKVELEVTFNTENWSSYKSANLLALGSGDPNQIADLLVTGHEDIGPYATAGYIVDVEWCIAQFPEVYNDFIDSLWEATLFQGKRWGIPQDTEARMVYFNKTLLAQAGFDADEIAAQIRAGQFTLSDLIEVGRALVEQGVVKPGKAIWHRPTPGTDWFQFIFAFGGRIYDSDTGKLVVDKSAILDTLNFVKALIDNDLTPAAMTEIAWPEIHRTFAVDRQVGIWLTGGSWNWGEWQRAPHNQPEDVLWENITFAPIPPGFEGGTPVSVSHPLVWLITKVTSSAEHPELNRQLACELITHVSSVERNTDHAIHSAHLAIRKSQLDYWRYKEDEFAAKVTEEVSPYARFSPNHENAPFYWEQLFQAIVAVETGALSPEDALNNMITTLQAQIPDLIVED